MFHLGGCGVRIELPMEVIEKSIQMTPEDTGGYLYGESGD